MHFLLLLSLLQVYENLVKQLEPQPEAVQQQQQQQQPNGVADPATLQPAGGPIADLPSDQHALVWIQYLRFARRESVTSSRRVSLSLYRREDAREPSLHPPAFLNSR